MTRNPQEQLVHFLSDMYSVEQQALAQMVRAPDIAGDPMLSALFRQHYAETEGQSELVRQRLEAHGGAPSKVKDFIMKLGGKGFLLFAQLMPETPGRLVTHAYSYEAMEWAGYEMLARFAEKAGDVQTIDTAKKIGAEERAMMQRLEQAFGAAESASHAAVTPQAELRNHVVTHLQEVHAFETQNIQLLEKSEQIAGGPLLQDIYVRHRERLREHLGSVEGRLRALGATSSTLKDSALILGGINWGLFFQAQSDTPAKLAAFVYAVLHLETAGYELLKRTAERAGDVETRQVCDQLVSEKRAMADNLYLTFDEAVEGTLRELGGKG